MWNFQDTRGQITKIISSDNDNVKCWVTWSDRDWDETQVETSGDHGPSVTRHNLVTVGLHLVTTEIQIDTPQDSANIS